MKTILASAAAVIFGLVALPEKAEARPHHHHHIGHSHTYCSGYASCGCRIYKRRVVVSYDCYHRPVYRYYSVPIVHSCRSHRHHHHHYRHRSHHRHHYHRDHYHRHHHHRGHHRRGVTISGRHGSIHVHR